MNHRIRQQVYYRFQVYSGFWLILWIGVGIIAATFLINDNHDRSVVVAIMLVLGLMIALSQFVTTVTSFTRVVKPLEHIFDSLKGWSDELNQEATFNIDNIKNSIQQLSKSAALIGQDCPYEFQKINATLIQLMKLVEDTSQRAVGNEMLVALGGICSQVAHDMRSPVAAIRAVSGTLDNGNVKNLIIMSADKLNRMADELLEYRRASVVDAIQSDLSQIFSAVIRELEVNATSRDIRLEVALPKEIPLMADGHRLGRVLQNLVQNSIQALSEAKHENGRIRIAASKMPDQVRIEISDNGPGIPTVHLNKMFKEGFTTKGNAGTGLGLVYCNNIIKAHGGQISVINDPDGGARFTIILPQQIAN